MRKSRKSRVEESRVGSSYAAIWRLVLSTRLLTLFCPCLLLTAFCLLPSAYCPAAGWLYKVQEVKPNVFVWVADDVLDLDGDPQFDRAGTAGFIVTPEGVIVVNTTNSPFHGRELLYEIRHHSELPVRYVIDTNSSGEQILGNEVFTDAASHPDFIGENAGRDPQLPATTGTPSGRRRRQMETANPHARLPHHSSHPNFRRPNVAAAGRAGD